MYKDLLNQYWTREDYEAHMAVGGEVCDETVAIDDKTEDLFLKVANYNQHVINELFGELLG
jgi:hypothetical protein